MTIVEVRRGIERLAKRKPIVAAEVRARVDRLIDAYSSRVVSIDGEVAAEWGHMQGQKGKDRDDLAFAASARVHGLTLVTRNTKNFVGRGVSVLDPFKNPALLQQV